MSLLDDKNQRAVPGGATPGALSSARNAVHDALEERIAQHGSRIRSVSKTPKSQATRERIMAAASELIITRRSTNFQMSEVSNLCKMSKGSLYYYFKDHDELVDAIFADMSESLLSSLQEVVNQAPSAQEAVVGMVSEVGRRLHQRTPLPIALTRELANISDEYPLEKSTVLRITKIVVSLLKRAQDEGAVREDIDLELAANFITGGFLVALLMDEASGQDTDIDRQVVRLFELSHIGVGLCKNS